MNKLKQKVVITFMILLGFGAIAAFYFFYNEQKEFSIKQKEFYIRLDNIKISKTKLKHIILKNYIYAYNNNDEIINTALELQKNYEMLIKSPILKDKKYLIIAPMIKKLGKDIKQTVNDVERWIMINANIKNSLIFLVGYDNNFTHKNNETLYYNASKIVESLLYVKRMSDLSYISKSSKLKLTNNLSPEEKKFVKAFNLHVTYILQNYPTLMKLEDKINSNELDDLLDKITEQFTNIAIHDIDFLNKFAFTLFLIFTSIYTYLIYILDKFAKEHNKLIRTTEKLDYLLKHDALTNLKSRYAFEEDIKNINNPSIILLNIDRFKDINDVYGNQVGNNLLKSVAKQLKEINSYIKELYGIYRVGGDEFCLLFEKANETQIDIIASNLKEAIDKTEFNLNGNSIFITISIGINFIEPLLENADLALKKAKKDNLLKIVKYSESLNLKLVAKNNINTLKMLKKAIKEDNLVTYFQPIINLKTNNIEKYESLVRIIDNGKVIPPYKFLEIAQKTQIYHQLTKIVIQKTIETAKIYEQFRFSINLSMSDILNDYLISDLFKIFEQNPTIASRIDIELLESEYLTDISKVKKFIDRLHSFGSLVLIDDFGSGYSNFAYFADLDIDIVKIDGSIINEIAISERKLHMLQSISMFCKGMNLKMVAEFVDNEDIVKILKNLDIDYAQGYYYSQPLKTPVSDISKLIDI